MSEHKPEPGRKHDPAGVPIPWKRILLPAEHGGWALVVEPAALGLLVAPSWPGLGVAIGALAGFLMHRPLEMRRTWRRRGVEDRRSAAATGAALLFAVLALAALTAAVATAGPRLLLPLALAAPFAAFFWLSEVRGEKRHLTAELAGPVAFAATAAAVALAAGWASAPALALSGAAAARAVPTVLYLRARLRRERGQPYQPWTTWAAHLAALVAVGALATIELLPATALAGFGLLALRSVIGLSPVGRPARPQRLGVREMLYGIFTVLTIAAGSW